MVRPLCSQFWKLVIVTTHTLTGQKTEPSVGSSNQLEPLMPIVSELLVPAGPPPKNFALFETSRS